MSGMAAKPMRQRPSAAWARIRLGALSGFYAWMAYGVVELWSLRLSRVAAGVASVSSIAEWSFDPLVLAVYGLAGLNGGAFLGSLLSAAPNTAPASSRVSYVLLLAPVLSVVVVFATLFEHDLLHQTCIRT